MPHIQELLHRFEPIGLHEIESVSLLKRRDTKYLFNANHLYSILEAINGHYRVLSVNHVRIQRYQNLYFDTTSFKLYLDHHNGKLNRYKVRCRKYLDSDLTFLEVKFKTNKGITLKKRVRIPDITTVPEEQAAEFMSQSYPFDVQSLEPTLWNSFLRVTMVSKYHIERITLDMKVNFLYDYKSVALPGIVIAEVKQPRFSFQSDFIQQMRMRKIPSTGLSKYCLGSTMIYSHLKSNNFKTLQRFIKKTMSQGAQDEPSSRSYGKVFNKLSDRNRYYPLHLLPAKP
jgi:hypothetical protein